MGGPPLTLQSVLVEYLSPLVAEGVTPILIFQGISISLNETKSLGEKAMRKANAWIEFSKGNKAELIKVLNQGKKVPWDVYSEVIKIVRALGGEVIRAPYHQASQLGYLENKGLVGGIMGSTELLFFNPEKVVINLHPRRREYDYITTIDVVQDLFHSTPEKLISAFIMKGYWFGRKCTKSSLEEILVKLRTTDYKSLAKDENEKQYLDQVHELVNSKISLEHSPPGINTRSDSLVGNLMGTKFTKEVYFALGLIPLSPQLFTTVANHKFVELPPFADSDYYRVLLRKLNPLRKRIISFFLEYLPPEYRQNDVKVVYWFDEKTTYSLPYQKIEHLKFDFTNAQLEEELNRQGKTAPDLQFCLKWHYDSCGNIEPKLSSPIGSEETKSDGHNMILTKVIFKCLESAGYISSNGKPMLFGKALMQSSSEWQIQSFYFQELLKFGILNGRTFGQKYLPDDVFEKLVGIPIENDDLRHQIRLISRVFSLVQPTLRNEPWAGVIDYDLSQFHALVKLITMTYQSIGEVSLLREFLSGRVSYSKALITVGEALPFSCHSNISLGIAIKKLLLGESIDDIRAELYEIVDLELDLRRGWHFWKNLLRILKTFDKYQTFRDKNFFNQILETSKILKSTLIRARLHVN